MAAYTTVPSSWQRTRQGSQSQSGHGGQDERRQGTHSNGGRPGSSHDGLHLALTLHGKPKSLRTDLRVDHHSALDWASDGALQTLKVD